jgi:hypothetical protein
MSESDDSDDSDDMCTKMFGSGEEDSNDSKDTNDLMFGYDESEWEEFEDPTTPTKSTKSTTPTTPPTPPTVEKGSYQDELRQLIELDYVKLRKFQHHMFRDEQMIRAILLYNGVHKDTLKIIIDNIKKIFYTTVDINSGKQKGFSIWATTDIEQLQEERIRVQTLIEIAKQFDPSIGQSICQNDQDRVYIKNIIGKQVTENLIGIFALIDTDRIHQQLEDLEMNDDTPNDFQYGVTKKIPVHRLFDTILSKKIKLRL